jgi:hypothetical protein
VNVNGQTMSSKNAKAGPVPSMQRANSLKKKTWGAAKLSSSRKHRAEEEIKLNALEQCAINYVCEI